MKNVKMAKVITMKIELNETYIMVLVTTVDPIVTPQAVYRMYELKGRVIESEESNVMPLPYALAHSYNQKRKFGIVH